MNDILKNAVVLVYYTKKTTTTLITSKDKVDEAFKRFKRFEIRQLGTPTCCDDCKYTSCWDYGKASRCSIKNSEE